MGDCDKNSGWHLSPLFSLCHRAGLITNTNQDGRAWFAVSKYRLIISCHFCAFHPPGKGFIILPGKVMVSALLRDWLGVDWPVASQISFLPPFWKWVEYFHLPSHWEDLTTTITFQGWYSDFVRTSTTYSSLPLSVQFPMSVRAKTHYRQESLYSMTLSHTNIE